MELRYLREAEEFARAHPDRAAALNLDKAGARIPMLSGCSKVLLS